MTKVLWKEAYAGPKEHDYEHPIAFAVLDEGQIPSVFNLYRVVREDQGAVVVGDVLLSNGRVISSAQHARGEYNL